MNTMAIEYSTKIYPPIAPYHEQMLSVSDGHTLYVEQSGNPNGVPVVFLHGGPGGATKPDHRRFFDPEQYRIVLFDQRGCGKSQPFATIENNTTQKLVQDIEAIRHHLNIQQWLVFGGSWGSTLALVYAQTHPQAVQALVLRGIFLGRSQEIHWLFQEGASHIFPDVWQQFTDFIPSNEHQDLVAAYHKRLNSQDEQISFEALKRWNTWEGAISRLYPSDQLTFSPKDLPIARLECHYSLNQCFLTPNQILENIEPIRHIPTTIVQGRYDIVCPVQSAYELSQAMPKAMLIIVPDAGHAVFEPGLVHHLVQATDAHASNLTG
jgi:proline iminopeptidase